MTNAPGGRRDQEAGETQQFSVPIPGLGGSAPTSPKDEPTTAIEIPDQTRVLPVERPVPPAPPTPPTSPAPPAPPAPPISSSPYSQQPINPYARPGQAPSTPQTWESAPPPRPAPGTAPLPAPVLPNSVSLTTAGNAAGRTLAHGVGAALLWMAVGFWVMVGARMARYLVDKGYDNTMLYRTVSVEEAATAAALAALGAIVLLSTRSGRRGLGWFALLVAAVTVALAVWRYLP